MLNTEFVSREALFHDLGKAIILDLEYGCSMAKLAEISDSSYRTLTLRRNISGEDQKRKNFSMAEQTSVR